MIDQRVSEKSTETLQPLGVSGLSAPIGGKYWRDAATAYD